MPYSNNNNNIKGEDKGSSAGRGLSSSIWNDAPESALGEEALIVFDALLEEVCPEMVDNSASMSLAVLRQTRSRMQGSEAPSLMSVVDETDRTAVAVGIPNDHRALPTMMRFLGETLGDVPAGGYIELYLKHVPAEGGDDGRAHHDGHAPPPHQIPQGPALGDINPPRGPSRGSSSSQGHGATSTMQDVRTMFADQEPVRASYHLLMNWPYCVKGDGPKSSGIACLAVLLRTMYAHLGASHWDRERTRVEEEQNPFMGHAWQSMKEPWGLHSAHLQKLVMEVWGMPVEGIIREGKAKELSFESLVNHQRMGNTIWLWPELQLHQTFYWKNKDDPTWTEYQPDSAPDLVNRQLKRYYPYALPKVIAGTLTPETDPSKAMNARFGTATQPSGQLQTVLRAMHPVFLYMTYRVQGVDSTHRITFEQMRTIWLKDWSGPKSNRDKFLKYILVLMVKYRKSDDECDLIRSFDVTGQPEEPHGNKEKYQGYLTDWKLEDCTNETTLFLVYAQDPFRANAAPFTPTNTGPNP